MVQISGLMVSAATKVRIIVSEARVIDELWRQSVVSKSKPDDPMPA